MMQMTGAASAVPCGQTDAQIQSSVNNAYRADIDGLRALAVSLVVLFHAGASWLPGGFIGVDVFFVISGFLITGLLVEEHSRTRRISLTAFWARRVRRLGPALLLVMAVVLPASMVFLSRIGTETGPAAKAALAALLLNANHFFLFESGDYFAAATETNPFLHTWSLSVEEQFYLVWPLALLAVLRRPGRKLTVWVTAALGLSVAGAAWSWANWSASAQFYLMPARAWELLAGALLAVVVRRSPKLADVGARMAAALAAVGLGLIVYSALNLTGLRGFPFPQGGGPVVGTVLLIWSGAAAPQNVVSRLVALPPVAYLGRISYPLYLWHWPLLVLSRGSRLWEPAPWADAAAVLVALAAAAATYEGVEKPWQRWVSRRSLRPGIILRLGGMATAVLLLIAGFVGAWARMGWWYSPEDRALAAARVDFPKTGCIFKDEFPDAKGLEDCYPSGQKRSILLWGDSHAYQWGPAVKAAAQQVGVEAGILALGDCLPLPMSELNARCQRFHGEVFSHLTAWQTDRGLQGVILAGRWASGMGLESPIWTERVPQGKETYFDGRARSTDDALSLFKSSLEKLLDAAGAAHLRVLLVLPSPLQRVKGPHCLSVRPADECFISRAEMAAYAARVEEVMKHAASGRQHVRLFDPKDFMCDGVRCPASLNGMIVYGDDNHITDAFSRANAQRFVQAVRWLAGENDANAGKNSSNNSPFDAGE